MSHVQNPHQRGVKYFGVRSSNAATGLHTTGRPPCTFGCSLLRGQLWIGSLFRLGSVGGRNLPNSSYHRLSFGPCTPRILCPMLRLTQTAQNTLHVACNHLRSGSHQETSSWLRQSNRFSRRSLIFRVKSYGFGSGGVGSKSRKGKGKF